MFFHHLRCRLWQGVPQTLDPYVDVTTLEGTHQVLARGPVASQEAIELLSGDGGGFFNANSAHPFENPPMPRNVMSRRMTRLGAVVEGRA